MFPGKEGATRGYNLCGYTMRSCDPNQPIRTIVTFEGLNNMAAVVHVFLESSNKFGDQNNHQNRRILKNKSDICSSNIF